MASYLALRAAEKIIGPEFRDVFHDRWEKSQSSIASIIDAEINAHKEQRLRELVAELQAAKDDAHETCVEGRMLEVTYGMENHPEWYEWGCLCDECMSYGDD